jgi:hypothetical protein
MLVILRRLYRYVPSSGLVVDKLLSIAALLAVYVLPAGFNPVRHISACLYRKGYVPADDPALETTQYHLLEAQDILFLLSFATSLIEQLPKAKFSQQEK